MACTVVILPAFERLLKIPCNHYPLAEKAIRQEIAALGKNPESGVVYPGFHPFQVRKHRIGLRAYRLSASRGLRLIFLHMPEKGLVVPLVIYKKGEPGREHEVKKLVVTQLQTVLAELTTL
jgi:plasmid stabilization system protein ParE